MELRTLYRRITVDMVTRLSDGSVLWPGEVGYEPATPQEITEAHSLCETCTHFRTVTGEKIGGCVYLKIRVNSSAYCSQHTIKVTQGNSNEA
jgi:hypothetical protein